MKILTRVAERLAQQKTGESVLGPVEYFWPGLILRNFMFVVTVLVHGFWRLLPKR